MSSDTVARSIARSKPANGGTAVAMSVWQTLPNAGCKRQLLGPDEPTQPLGQPSLMVVAPQVAPSWQSASFVHCTDRMVFNCPLIAMRAPALIASIKNPVTTLYARSRLRQVTG